MGRLQPAQPASGAAQRLRGGVLAPDGYASSKHPAATAAADHAPAAATPSTAAATAADEHLRQLQQQLDQVRC